MVATGLLFLSGVVVATQGAGPKRMDPSSFCESMNLSGEGETRSATIIQESKKSPNYPEAARKARLAGQVLLWVTINSEGVVTDTVVVKSDPPGYGFEESAQEAVAQWRYQPATCDGQSIQISQVVSVAFSTNGPSLTKREIKRAAKRARPSPNIPRNISIGKKNIVYVAGEKDVTNPTPIDTAMVRPVFPERARSQITEARVVLQVVVRRDGSVTDIETIRSSAKGYGFEEAAIAAVQEWRYRPATRNGVPVDVSFTIKVTFNLD
jgi:TonB family protein